MSKQSLIEVVQSRIKYNKRAMKAYKRDSDLYKHSRSKIDAYEAVLRDIERELP